MVSDPLLYNPKRSVALVLETGDSLRLLDANQFDLFNQKFQNSLSKTIQQGKGVVLYVDDASCRAVFPSASSAIFAAHKIHDDFKYVTPKITKDHRRLHMALAPVPSGFAIGSASMLFFEELTRLCEFMRFDFIITRDLRKAYRKENKHAEIDEDLIYVLSDKEKLFFRSLMEYVKKTGQTWYSRGRKWQWPPGTVSPNAREKSKNLPERHPMHFSRTIASEKP
ncbi:hypothetical protein [Muriicola jejuensis]|uniref:hypothetical protein n=1 Tax=Muriicola jejuensis TaxID=504488 RepID=UPI001EF8E1AA|nr:hypothetical protein [Muriicola jejuensis]